MKKLLLLAFLFLFLASCATPAPQLTSNMDSRTYLNNIMKNYTPDQNGHKSIAIPGNDKARDREFIYWNNEKSGVFGWGYVFTEKLGGKVVWQATDKTWWGLSLGGLIVLSDRDAQISWEAWVAAVKEAGILEKAGPLVERLPTCST